jgi:hypothetical protein
MEKLQTFLENNFASLQSREEMMMSAVDPVCRQCSYGSARVLTSGSPGGGILKRVFSKYTT